MMNLFLFKVLIPLTPIHLKMCPLYSKFAVYRTMLFYFLNYDTWLKGPGHYNYRNR